MTFKFIDEELNALGLTLINLNALTPDDGLYSVLLNQFLGKLELSKNGIGNSASTHDEAIQKFESFLSVAAHDGYDLVACPEYSCPWQCIETTIDKNQFPEQGKIWILGSEGIKPSSLSSFIQKHSNVTWIYDQDLLATKTDKTLLDPVCIFFKARDQQNNVKEVCAVQFKNKHMSVQGHGLREVDVLIEGRYFYVIRNSGSSVNLIIMVCSDSLDYNHTDILNHNLDKLLLVHLQMNADPRHHIFKRYRDDIFVQESAQMELICLNWSKGSKVGKVDINFSGTGYFTKATKPVLTDDRLNDNQKSGLYYTYWSKKQSHLYFFPSDESLFGFRTHKASQALAAAPLRRRDGAMGIGSYTWDITEHLYKFVETIDESFSKYCASFKTDLSPLDKLTYLDKERLLKLSSASNLNQSCFEIPNCDYFMIDDVEIIKRLTYVDEVDTTATATKKVSIFTLKELVSIYKNDANVPEAMAALIGKKISYSKIDHPFFNVYDPEKGPIGLIIYLGANVLSEARSIYNYVEGLILATNLNPAEKSMIIVWYVDNGLKSYSIDNHLIDVNVNENQVSITKEEQ